MSNRPKLSKPLRNSWRWRDLKGQHHILSKMSTNFMYDSLLLIWNNTVPEKMRVVPFKPYNFPANHYTTEYLCKAVNEFLIVLHKRKDLSKEQVFSLNSVIFRAKQLANERLKKRRNDYK